MGRNSGKLRHEHDNNITIDFHPGITTWFQIDLEMRYLKRYFEVPVTERFALTTMLV